MSKLNNLDFALETLLAGEMIILADSKSRENEGDFIIAAEYITPDAVNFMLKEARGLLCVPMLGNELDRIGIPQMVSHNTALHQCAFTVSVDAAKVIGTGSSAHDRAQVIKLLADGNAVQSDFAMPGHVFPLRCHPDGIRGRQGHTEGTVTLMQLAGLKPIGVLCEILNEDGTMARRANLVELAKRHRMPLITTEDILTFIHK